MRNDQVKKHPPGGPGGGGEENHGRAANNFLNPLYPKSQEVYSRIVNGPPTVNFDSWADFAASRRRWARTFARRGETELETIALDEATMAERYEHLGYRYMYQGEKRPPDDYALNFAHSEKGTV